MKSKGRFWYIIAAIPILLVLAVITLAAVKYYASYRYLKQCLHSNEAELEQLADYVRGIYAEGDSSVKIDEESCHDEIMSILDALRAKYQSDSEYPVFSGVEAYFDKDGDVLFCIQAKKDRLKKGDGIDSPDIRCYCLVYVDEAYDGDQRFADGKPIWGSWHTWSFDTYSG